MSELALLKILSNKEHYDKYHRLIKSGNLEQEIQLIFQAMSHYFKTTDTLEIDWDNFSTWFFYVQNPDLSKAKKDTINVLFQRLKEYNVENVEVILAGFEEQVIKQEIVKAIDENKSLDFVQELLANYVPKLVTNDDCVLDNNLEDILAETNQTDGLHWRLSCLEEALGPIKKGHLIIVAAFVDVGKTTFAVSEASHMARQLTEGCVLWFNNEEANRKVQSKIWKSVLGIDDFQLTLNTAKAKEEYIKRMNGDLDRIRLIDARGLDLAKIKDYISRYEPKLIVIDQVDHIQHKQKDFSEHGRLKGLYQQVREIACNFCPVIAVSQMDAQTTWNDRETFEKKYQLYPHFANLDGSKVGKPGAADAIIGIGKRGEDHDTTRGIYVSKNKLGKCLKIKQEVGFNPAIARYVDCAGL